MELLDIVDDLGNPTGEIVDRSDAHLYGIQHRTSHVWILRIKDNQTQILLQKRSDNKDSFPGCYDISSAGHIPAGIDFYSSAIRELKEELGIEVEKEMLIDCGNRKGIYEGFFNNRVFKDYEIQKVFKLYLDLDEVAFTFTDHEVESVMWMNFDVCIESVRNNTIKHCIYLDELEMLKK